MDPRSPQFVTYENEIESKGVQFHGRDAPDMINRGV